MTTPIEIEAAMAEALEAVEKKQAQEQAEAKGQAEPQTEEIHASDESDIAAEPEIESPGPVDEAQAEPEVEEKSSEPGATELKDQLMRLAADFENFKKRTRREKEDIRKFANEKLLKDILPALDNLNRALAHVQDRDNPLVQGIEMVAKQFLDILDGYGVTSVTSKGKPFDPAIHDAMGQIPSEEVQPGCIADEFEKGYLIHGRLLRPAKVIVATAPVVPEEPKEENSDNSQDSSAEH